MIQYITLYIQYNVDCPPGFYITEHFFFNLFEYKQYYKA